MMLREFELGGGFALLHDMGTGKTLTALGTFAILAARGDAETMFVACPTTVSAAWAADAEWIPSVDVVVLSDKSAPAKAKKLARIEAELDGYWDGKPCVVRGPSDPMRPLVIVCNYESIWRDDMVPALKQFGFDVVAADECQRIKSAGSNQSMMMAAMAKTRSDVLKLAPRRIGMTGTPSSEGSIDLYGQYRFIDRSIFGGSFVNFKNEYFTTTMIGPAYKQFPKIEPRPDKQDELIRKMMSIAHVVKSEDVLDLPPETDRIVMFDLPPKVRKIYDELEAECFAELEDGFGPTGEIEADHILTKMMRLHEISLGGIRLDGSDSASFLHDVGTKALIEDIRLAQDNDRRCVVFHRYTREGLAIVDSLAKAKGFNVVHLTADMDADQRAAAIRLFQRGEHDVFVTQIRLGGLGITLTAACESMFYSTGASGEEHQQARRRTARDGQTKPVTHSYYAARDTVSEKFVHAIREKRSIAEELVAGGWRDYLRRPK